MNRVKTEITPRLKAEAAKRNCRVEITPDGYIEIFPLAENEWFEAEAATSLIADCVEDAMQRLASCSLGQIPPDDDPECMYVKTWGF